MRITVSLINIARIIIQEKLAICQLANLAEVGYNISTMKNKNVFRTVANALSVAAIVALVVLGTFCLVNRNSGSLSKSPCGQYTVADSEYIKDLQYGIDEKTVSPIDKQLLQATKWSCEFSSTNRDTVSFTYCMTIAVISYSAATLLLIGLLRDIANRKEAKLEAKSKRKAGK